MPVRVKAKPPQRRDFSPVGGNGGGLAPAQFFEWELPQIGPEDDFKDLVEKLSM